ncbi:MAG: TonB-dependent receptor, partial [Bacteroidales bacterium]|nr:TonB-dependent receptor [Bacteroidales bacterium]
IPFANVLVILEDNTVFAYGTVSDKDGSFYIGDLSFGNFHAVISFMGYEPDTIKNINIDRQNQHVNIGKIQLSVLPIALSEVVIKAWAKTVITNLDRVTYRTQDFQTTKGGNAADVLNKLPSVSIDQNGIISVRGTPDFMVYLNGKPIHTNSTTVLSQIRATDIESIDVISIPSAKYDAQGKGGIINITTKKTDEKGLSISASGLIGGAPWDNYTHQLSNYNVNDNRFGGGFNFIYSKNKLSLYGGLNFNEKNVNGTRSGFASLWQENGSYFHMVPNGPRVEWSQNYTANVVMDYQLSNKSIISVLYFYGNSSKGRSALYNYHTFYSDVDKNPLINIPINEYWIYNPNMRMRYGIFHTANIDYFQKIDYSSELKISALFEHSELRSEMDNRQYQLNPLSELAGDIEKHFIQTDNTPLDGYRLSVDYTKKLNNEHTLCLGIQPQYFLINGAFSFDTLDVINNVWGDNNYFENAIDFRRGIYAGYVDYSGSLDKFNFMIGLRLEYTDQVMDIENPDYFTIFDRITKSSYGIYKLDWFPTIHMNYAISENDKVSFAFSRRVSRPPLTKMKPFLYREHFEVYVVGDPTLEPEYHTNFELALNKNIKKSNINLIGFYRETDNAVFRVNTVYKKENVLIRSYTNSANTQATGIELNMSFIAGNFAKFFISSSLYNFRVEADIFEYNENNRSTNWSLKGNANFNLTESLKFIADIDFKSATITAQGRDKMFYMTNISLNYTPKRLKGWDFSLKALNILNSNIINVSTRAFNSNGEQLFFQESEYYRNGPIIELNVFYYFNMKGKSSKKAESTFGKEQF